MYILPNFNQKEHQCGFRLEHHSSQLAVTGAAKSKYGDNQKGICAVVTRRGIYWFLLGNTAPVRLYDEYECIQCLANEIF